jgi:hypothetical protein
MPRVCNQAARSKVKGGDMAFCIAGLQPNGDLAPQWWLLIQRITIRWIWVRYTDMRYGGNELAKYETVVAHVLSDVKFRLIIVWDEMHSSVVNKVSLRSQGEGAGTKSLKTAGRENTKMFMALATLRRNATRNDGIRGEGALRFSGDLYRALKSW